jgi:iron(III) transport system ATP-binding protein
MANDIEVEFRDVRKMLGTNQVLKGISFTVRKGSFVTLLGGSGSGKTTTLRLLAGLESLDSGVITIGGQTMDSVSPRTWVPPERRHLGLMFQSYALWPHMTIFDQVAYPLKVRREVKRLNERVNEALERVGLVGLNERYPSELSGGQQQRVALARAVVHEPKLLLLDEPLSNLDAALRERMRHEIQQLHHQLGLTTIYVTHDQQEALSLSDDVILMTAGEILEHGNPKEIYESPSHEETARFVGASNMLRGRVSDTASASATSLDIELDCGVAISAVPRDRALLNVSAGATVVAAVKPEQIALAPAPDEAHPIAATIDSVAYLGWHSDIIAHVADEQIHVRTLTTAVFRPGDKIGLGLPAEELPIFVTNTP